MIGGILVLILTGFISFLVIERMGRKYSFVDTRLLKKLFFYHLLLSFAYFGYALFNPSDSRFYYLKVVTDYRGDSWSDFYGTSTTFIEWFSYPFIRFLGFSYEATMALFIFLGFLGFVYFYIFFRENLRFNHYFAGYNLLTITLFLPNLHFWSASIGKGSIIFFGIGLFFYGISRIRHRALAVIIGGLIVYHVRPHVMLVILVSSAIGFVFSARQVNPFWRVMFLAVASIAFFYIYEDVLSMVGLEEGELFTEGLDMSHRASELTKATSGVDITQYNLAMQLFTFLYRPLFVDAPGMLGLIVSFENVFYLLISLMVFGNINGVKFLFTGSFLVKSAFLSFFTISIALAQVSGNLGLAMRQKSQVMILLMFVVLAFMDERRFMRWKMLQRGSLRAAGSKTVNVTP